ncbi:4-hydroxy-3-methylbut-2-enyl diphosphate reductase [Anoxybacillus sp. B7M1]|jgi:4-hydroxy-3-methylbut-2-en-1-yl diphosphate reductase|uniref:4-hydroxy-3-methylbut-2-enyl diphosphate reductase n=1 Tax=Anoxybacteroides rupiense TaxID=311460 RepID=A0ABD5IRH2_9BACL|nr:MULTISPECIES: 4-hydroxy-3-methylbut-2-enyl diphosphate reductase [Anoxybacillus]ANB55628.1 4-hydroxy-3-methylbut-2-enyl diphosphate reductase [Anoxybacillus sp. B2M1]ANB66088.1 4-hydroxy-3-methylbut-2-enyl diphosphate reductase [Anoxybacillus sp. B7M1]KXG11308.1 4-hydroxy-3-methylbut-2-enyl diphosphate reductase [Anoxybacillus sp. P3H1B]MBB3906886.1 4-hydroxy-3-methylbut-2-enyl diphosphate reductase [Anoxybacillus rupiensis]MBS2770005.1 4-hydroxy-3-methylbut-2-enyl diphosphate reductase [An
MEVIKITPRGYCYGVVDAMVMARNAALDPTLPRPIYILGMIVHNKHVTDAFSEEGIITLDGENRLELLEKIEHGTVIFTAHGVSPEVKKRAREKGLVTIDATCPDVTKTHDLIREKLKAGYEIIYIGKKGHPEPEGAIGIDPSRIHLVETLADVDKLNIHSEHIMVTNQTTMSQWDVADIMKKVQEKYPQVEVHKEICLATQLRQEAVAEQAKEADVTIVVGDPRSNNSNRLAQVSEEIAGTKAYRIADVTEIEIDWIKDAKKVAVTAGASTPTPITKEVIEFLQQFDPNNPETWKRERKVPLQKILPKVKTKQQETGV